jgi:spore coat polysaccharide biosynthesis predicted glycosyltransferase SpsG
MIENYAKDRGIKVIINAENMSELMFEADLAIGAGGSTSWERWCLGLPTLLFVTAENQRVAAQNLEHLGAVIVVKNLKDDFQAIVGCFSMWQAMSKNTQTICDGLGVKRIGI